MSSNKEEWTYGIMYSNEMGMLEGMPFRIGKECKEVETVKCGMGLDAKGIFDPELYKLHKKHQYDYSVW